MSSTVYDVSLPANDQGVYLNRCVKTITQVPIIDLAYLSNTAKNIESADVVLNLNPVCLSWCDFLNSFFTSQSGAFWINPSNRNSCAVLFNSQSYETTQNKAIHLNLADLVRKTWATKNSKLATSIPIKSGLILNKDLFFIKGLGNSAMSVGLGLDQAISTLLTNKDIAPGDLDSSATVKFVISYAYYFEELDTSALLNFVYITKIPCYKNVNDCDSFCAYSKDESCRPCLDFKDDESLLSFDEKSGNHSSTSEDTEMSESIVPSVVEECSKW
jgi:hypothetical protein